MESRLEKFRKLKEKRAEAVVANSESVAASSTGKKKSASIHPKDVARQNKAKVWLKEQEMRENGIDVERERLKHYTAEEVEKWNKKLAQKKETEDLGFTDFAQISQKKYERQIRNFKQDKKVLLKLEEEKNTASGSGFTFATTLASSSLDGKKKDSKEKSDLLDKLVSDLNQEESRKNSSAKRKFYNEDEDVTYINYKNELFNKKLSRAYDKYTKDIKESFERGTAL